MLSDSIACVLRGCYHDWSYVLKLHTTTLVSRMQTGSMSVPAPPRAVSPLGLPAAALHDRAHAEPHPDSEVAVRYERQRYSQELGPVRRERTTTLNEPRAIPSLNSIRSRNALLCSSTNDSTEDLRRHASDISITSAQVNVYQEGPGRDEVARTERWYDPVVKFWTAHVSLSIDEGAHRDHLGISPSLSTLGCFGS